VSLLVFDGGINLDGVAEGRWKPTLRHSMEHPAPTGPSQPDADRHSRLDVRSRRAAENRRGERRDPRVHSPSPADRTSGRIVFA
jgi:hypothetical protein